jgi:3-oxoacyl-[acyl-carrier protein] reductase
VIIVTGASRGLGRTVCERLVSQGIEVLGVSRSKADLPFESIQCDVSSIDQIKEMTRSVKQSGKRVSGLINAAGIASMNLALTMPLETSKKLVETNLLGTIYTCQALALLMVRNGGGSIINFSTIAVPLAISGEAVYAASKAGVEGFTRTFAREMSAFNVRANCIAPGPIDTEMLKGVSSDQIDEIVSRQIIRKQFTPDDICDLVEVLLDPKSESMSGQVLNVGGV